MSLLDIIYPTDCVCFLCGREAHTDARGLCESCADALRPAVEEKHIRGLDGSCAGFVFDETIQKAVYALKYNGARYMGERLAGLIDIPPEWAAEALVPVPIAKRRFRERGYNQSALISAALSARTGIPTDEGLLFRIRETGTQTALDKSGRAKNVRGAFRAADSALGMTLILIDDVTTTGATLSECAAALRASGALKVYAATVCRRGS